MYQGNPLYSHSYRANLIVSRSTLFMAQLFNYFSFVFVFVFLSSYNQFCSMCNHSLSQQFSISVYFFSNSITIFSHGRTHQFQSLLLNRYIEKNISTLESNSLAMIKGVDVCVCVSITHQKKILVSLIAEMNESNEVIELN